MHNLKCTFSGRTHVYIGLHFSILFPVLIAIYFSGYVGFDNSLGTVALAETDVTRAWINVSGATVKVNQWGPVGDSMVSQLGTG